jgi:hypothetical protein
MSNCATAPCADIVPRVSRRRRAKDAMPRKIWTQKERDYLAETYPAQPTSDIAKTLNRSTISTYGMANKLGLKKSPEFIRSEASGRLQKGNTPHASVQFRFQKGQTPANKGLRRPGWSPGRMSETQFRKGQRTGMARKNWKPIGTILPDHEGYQRIKVREAIHGKEATGFGNTKVWPLLNRHTWEQNRGPIPPGHAVAFKDKNRQNCAIENLELISRKELARRNHMWNPENMPRELAEAIQLNSALRRQIRSKHGKEQDQRSA